MGWPASPHRHDGGWLSLRKKLQAGKCFRGSNVSDTTCTVMMPSFLFPSSLPTSFPRIYIPPPLLNHLRPLAPVSAPSLNYNPSQIRGSPGAALSQVSAIIMIRVITMGYRKPRLRRWMLAVACKPRDERVYRPTTDTVCTQNVDVRSNVAGEVAGYARSREERCK